MAAQSLFRQEAISFQQQSRQWGRVAHLQPFSTKLLTWLLAASVAVIIGFLFTGQYARKETVVGYLTPTSGTSKVFVSQHGTIKQVYVSEGQDVREGQPLLTIETSQIAENDRDVNGAMLETLSLQAERLKKQIIAEQIRTKSEQDRLTEIIDGFEKEIDQLQAQIKTQSERIQISQELVSTASSLKSKGFMSDVEFKARQLAVLEQTQNQQALTQQLAARRSQLIETRYKLQQLPTVMAEKIQSLQNDLSNAEQRIAEINGRRAYVLRAPTAGRISTLQATVGQFADPRRLQMEILPPDGMLQAELFVPARAIGFVQPGQEVRVLYDAFPYQNFGAYTGRIIKVSQTILTGNDASGPIMLKEPAYRITATLDRWNIDAYGKTIPLQADMLLHADIILERRSLMNWLLDPLLSVRM